MTAPAGYLILVVSYRNNAQLLSFFEQSSLSPKNLPGTLHVVAVANGLSPHERTDLRSAVAKMPDLRPDVRAPEVNLGYFGGAAHGLAAYLQQHPLPDWVMVTNDDIYFANDFFARLAALALPARTGVVAPDIVVPATGIHQNPYLLKRLSRFHLEVSRVIYRHAWLYRAFAGVRTARKAVGRPGGPSRPGVSAAIYAPHGACILFHAEYFRAGGTLAHLAFLYGEENFVAETCAERGLGVRYEPDLRAEHHEHSAMGRIPSSLQLRYMHDATQALLRHYYHLGRNRRG